MPPSVKRPHRARTDNPKTGRITINLPESLKRELEAEADREQRSMSFIMVVALKEYLRTKGSAP